MLASSVSIRGTARSSVPTTERITDPSDSSTAETSSSEPCWLARAANFTLVPPPT
jgi:hypothetical protein